MDDSCYNLPLNLQQPLSLLRKKMKGSSHRQPQQPAMSRPRSFSEPENMNRTRSSDLGFSPRRRRLIEDHYKLSEEEILLEGIPAHDEDWSGAMHDFFNLIALVPVCVLNGLCWNFDLLLDPKSTVQGAWNDDYFPLFFSVTVGYFLADLLWVLLEPSCVKSPTVIVQHHIATLMYLSIPYLHDDTHWLMGACMSVEVNTWLLIARRVFNKQGLRPWVINLGFSSVRIKFISVMFYITWVVIRCYVYPAILRVLIGLWSEKTQQTGGIYNYISLAIVLHSVFCLLNFKWTFDLLRGKYKAIRYGKSAKIEKGL